MFQINLPTTDEYILNKNYNCIYVKHNDLLQIQQEILDTGVRQIKNDNLIRIFNPYSHIPVVPGMSIPGV